MSNIVLVYSFEDLMLHMCLKTELEKKNGGNWMTYT